MAVDTRDKNQYFDASTINTYLNEYAYALLDSLQCVDKDALKSAVLILAQARHQNRRVFSAGNGGSASIAEHLECDFQKGCEVKKKSFLTKSLVSNFSLISAIANDISYDQIFRYQLELEDLKAEEVVVLISSSGNSKNIVEAAHFAKGRGAFVIGLTGFDGGELKKLASISLHVPYHNYGIVEDTHQALMHTIAQFLYLKLSDHEEALGFQTE